MRPAIGRMVINLDISTGTVYKPGPLIGLCLEFFQRTGQNPAQILGEGLPGRQRNELVKFIRNVRIVTKHQQVGGQRYRPRAIRDLSTKGANKLEFELTGGGTQTVAVRAIHISHSLLVLTL